MNICMKNSHEIKKFQHAIKFTILVRKNLKKKFSCLKIYFFICGRQKSFHVSKLFKEENLKLRHFE